ncbi:MAG: hypothetical protein R3E95_07290 [Thiolinea sp.]
MHSPPTNSGGFLPLLPARSRSGFLGLFNMKTIPYANIDLQQMTEELAAIFVKYQQSGQGEDRKPMQVVSIKQKMKNEALTIVKDETGFDHLLIKAILITLYR